jgi:hypothetical protein
MIGPQGYPRRGVDQLDVGVQPAIGPLNTSQQIHPNRPSVGQHAAGEDHPGDQEALHDCREAKTAER